MKIITALILITVLLRPQGVAQQINEKNAPQFVCLPCGSSCDTLIYNKPGTCGHCHMQLVDKSTITHKQLSPAALCAYINTKGNENVVLLDVRTPEEYNGTAAEKFGRLANAVNIPLQQLAARLGELKMYGNKEIIVYCSHSHRSPQASYMLTQNGFAHVTNLQGGMATWQQQVKDGLCNTQIYISQ